MVVGAVSTYFRRLEGLRFFLFWYQRGAGEVGTFGWGLARELWQTTAPLLMLRLLFTPLFGDYTWQGLIIGITARLARAITGFLLSAAALLFGLFLLLLWLLLPPFLLYLIVANLLAL